MTSFKFRAHNTYWPASCPITVRFAAGSTYLYDQTKPGNVHVAQMISLASAGAGLAT